GKVLNRQERPGPVGRGNDGQRQQGCPDRQSGDQTARVPDAAPPDASERTSVRRKRFQGVVEIRARMSGHWVRGRELIRQGRSKAPWISSAPRRPMTSPAFG